MEAITIYGFAGSTYVRTARMAFEERGVPYELEPVDYGSDAHAEVHPYRRMPAMRNGSLHLFEAHAIAAYADAVGTEGAPLQPSDPADRARMLQWVSAVGDYVYPNVVRALLEAEGDLGAEKVDAARRALEPFDLALRDSDWLAGEAISLADLFLAPIDAFGESGLGESGALDDLAGFASWRERIRARPSFTATAP